MATQHFLNLRSFQANFEVRLNDVLVESDYENRNLSFAVPVNHWLRKGKNLLSFRLIPYEDETSLRLNARLDLAIQESVDNGTGEELELRDHHVVNTQEISGQFDEAIPGFAHTSVFGIDAGLELPWEAGEQIELDESSVRSVRAVWQRLHRFIADRDAAGFVAYTKDKIRDCAKALDWDLEEDIRFSLEHYREIFSRPGYVVWPLSEQQLIPAVEAGGRLVTLRNEKRQPPLLLYNAEEGNCIFIDIRLYRPKGSAELVVIR